MNTVGEYELASLEDFDNFKAECLDHEGWSVCTDGKQTTVWTRDSSDSSINVVKLRGHVPGVSAETLYDVLHDPEYRKTWDDNMVAGYNIQQLDPYNDIGYYGAKFPRPMAKRDFCNQRSWWVAEDRSEYIIMNHSVPHVDCPEKKGFVRAISLKTGYFVQVDPDDEDSCILFYMTQADPKGWIPGWAVNKATKTLAPKVVKNLEKVGSNYAAWKDEHDPEDRPWLTDAPYWWQQDEE
eukprot:TRINITY_DN3319_c0_g1_i1.p1 TRINITY_DN3319_c0_g1~~TRINITY_DN3319_c0_g1_i1.p1  ORF type:complete len:247 (-),score=64.21 TRINITY_DN3319_c0_g1_i1:23-736(-)